MDRTQHPLLAAHNDPPELVGLPAAERTAAGRPTVTHSHADAGRNSAGPPPASVPPGYRTVSAGLVSRK